MHYVKAMKLTTEIFSVRKNEQKRAVLTTRTILAAESSKWVNEGENDVIHLSWIPLSSPVARAGLNSLHYSFFYPTMHKN